MTKMIIIGDRITVTGMKLAGLKNCIPADENSVDNVLRAVPRDIDIIVISHSLREMARETLLRMKEKMIIELPESKGEGEDMVARMIRDVIGFDTS